MFKAIARFFSDLFGSNDLPVNSAATDPREDGADLPHDQSIGALVSGTTPEALTRSLSPQPETRTRGLDVTVTSDDGMQLGAGRVGDTATSLSEQKVAKPRYLWCLDAGHGRLQPGKRSPILADGRQFFEWEFTRDVVRRMAISLNKMGIQYYICVPETEVSDFLKERVQRANAIQHPMGLPKIFVSVHANAAGDGVSWNAAEGLETFCLPGSATGKKIAATFQKYLVGSFPTWRNRGVKEANFYVLAKTSMPSVLTENGFYTHETQTKQLLDPTVRQRIADAHVAAILEIETKGL